LAVVSEAKDCRGFLDLGAPFNLDHLVFVGGDSVALVFFDYNGLHNLLLFNRFTLAINLIILFFFFLLFFLSSFNLTLLVVFLWLW
jgi:hypothetical protein